MGTDLCSYQKCVALLRGLPSKNEPGLAPLSLPNRTWFDVFQGCMGGGRGKEQLIRNFFLPSISSPEQLEMLGDPSVQVR